MIWLTQEGNKFVGKLEYWNSNLTFGPFWMLESGEIDLGIKQTPLFLRFCGLHWCRHAACFSKRRVLLGSYPRQSGCHPEHFVIKWSFVPGLSMPSSHLLPDPVASFISSLLNLFNLSLSTGCFSLAYTLTLVPQILKQWQNPPMDTFPSQVTVPFSFCHLSIPASSTSSPPIYSLTLQLGSCSSLGNTLLKVSFNTVNGLRFSTSLTGNIMNHSFPKAFFISVQCYHWQHSTASPVPPRPQFLSLPCCLFFHQPPDVDIPQSFIAYILLSSLSVFYVDEIIYSLSVHNLLYVPHRYICPDPDSLLN